jgi:hypothetical protein
MSFSKRQRASSLLALAGWLFLCGTAAPPAPSFEQQGRMCVAATEMSALAGTLAAGDYLEHAGAGTAVSVRRDGDRLWLHNTTLGIDRTVPFAGASTGGACSTSPQEERLATPGTIPLAYLASFAQVLRYRSVHAPAGGADVMKGVTSTILATYGPYVLVMFWTPPQGLPVSLNCLGLEYYRVDPRANAVLPFDGCVEGHERTLPSLRQLPAR